MLPTFHLIFFQLSSFLSPFYVPFVVPFFLSLPLSFFGFICMACSIILRIFLSTQIFKLSAFNIVISTRIPFKYKLLPTFKTD